MEHKIKVCDKCGSPVKLIPPNGLENWGKEVESKSKPGNKYYPFYKCENCSWSFSSDPSPRKYTRKPQTPVKTQEIIENNTTNSQLNRIESKIDLVLERTKLPF